MKDKLSCRYYMDLTEVFEAGYGVEDVQLKLGSHEGATLSGLNKYRDNIYYFIVDFTGTQIMPSEWQMCEKDANVEISLPNGVGTFENDWSYQNLSSSPDYSAVSFKGMTHYIPVYDNGVKIYGLEPGEGSDPSPTATPIPTIGLTNTPTPTVRPTVVPTPTVTPRPTVTQTYSYSRPTVTPKPTVTPTPTVAPRPTVSPTPTMTPRPTVAQQLHLYQQMT